MRIHSDLRECIGVSSFPLRYSYTQGSGPVDRGVKYPKLVSASGECGATLSCPDFGGLHVPTVRKVR